MNFFKIIFNSAIYFLFKINVYFALLLGKPIKIVYIFALLYIFQSTQIYNKRMG